MASINIGIKRKHVNVGKKRRVESVMKQLTGNISFPKPVHYEDIDRAVQEWIDKSIDIQYENATIPTIKLFSNQRISEYSQTWDMQDSNGNVKMNFKTITRENNPSRGTIYGDKGNIPGERQYLIGYKEVMDENGDIAYDAYSMMQPYAANLIYKIGIITNKFELVNLMSERMLNEFKSIQKYIFPNGHAMSMILDNVTDASEGGVADRKFYYQEFSITLRSYIIDEKYFKITRLPNRAIVTTSVASNGKSTVRKKPSVIVLSKEDMSSIIVDCSSSESSIEVEYNGNNTIHVDDIELTGIDSIDRIEVNREEIKLGDCDEFIIEPDDKILIVFKKDLSSQQNTITLTGSI